MAFGTGGAGGGGFTLGPAQNVFTGADRTAAEAARDLYDTNNPGWIDDYDNDTALNIRLEYSDSGNDVALFQVRNDAGDTWLDNSSATGVRGEDGGATNFASITSEGQVPSLSADLTNYEYSGATVDPTDSTMIFDNSVQVPQRSLRVGEVVTISEGQHNIVISDTVDGGINFATLTPWSTAGASLPAFVNLGAEFNNLVQPVDTTTITANPLNFSVTSSIAPITNIRQINEITFRTGAIMTNVRVQVIDNASGVVIEYIPDRAACISGVGGLDFVSGDNQILLMQIGTDTPGVFFLGLSPLRLTNGQQLDFIVDADSVSLLGNVSNVPYIDTEAQDGPTVQLQTSAGTVFTAGSVPFANASGHLTDDNAAFNFNDTSDRLTVQNVTITNDLLVSGTATFINSENLSISDSFIDMNAGLVGVVAREGGLAVNYLPTSTDDTVTAGAFVAGIASTSNPTVATDTATVFSANDIVQISMTDSSENDGFYEVLTHAANVLTVKGIGVTGTVESFSRNQFVANASDNAVITLINVSIIDSGFDGNWETAKGSSTDSLDFRKLAQGPATTTVNGLAFWDVTDGSSLGQASRITVLEGVTDNRIDIEPATVAGSSIITLSDVGGGTDLMFAFDQGTGRSSITSDECPLDISTADDDDINISIGGSLSKLSILGPLSPDTSALVNFTTGGANGISISHYYGDRDPNGNVAGVPGDLYFRKSGSSSTIYIHEGVGSSSTDWVSLISGTTGVIGPASSTDNGLVIWDGGTGKLIKSPALMTTVSSASSTRITVQSPSVSGISGFFIANSSGLPTCTLEYLEGSGLARLLANAADFQLEASAEINIFTTSATDKIILAGTTLPDTLPLVEYLTGGANGTSCDTFYGGRDPNGNVTGSPGDLYFRSDNADSTIYIHEGTGSSNTDWVSLLSSSGGVTGPASSTNNGIPTWDGTTGKLLQDTPVTIESGASNTIIYIESPSLTGNAEIILTDSVGDAKTTFEYIESSDLSRILATASDLDIVTSGDMTLQVQGATSQIILTGSALPDTLPLIQYLTSGTNGTSCDTFYGTRDPNSNVIGSPGDLYFRSDNADSTIYIHEGTGATNTDWVSLLSASGGVSGPATSTNNSIPTWNGTDGSTLADEPNLRTAIAGSIFKIELEAPAVNDTARYELLDSSSVSAAYWQFNDQSKLTLMLSEAGDIEVGSQFDDLILSVNANDAEIQIQGYTLPDTQNLLSLTTGGANGAAVNLHVGTRNPNENITALDGALYLRKNGIDSNIYLQNDSGSSTSWSKLMLDSDTNAFGGFGHYENLLTFSEDMTNAIWTQPGSRVTVTGNTTIAPNRETTADTVQWDLVGLGLRQSVTLVESSVYTVSFWAIHISGNDTLSFDLGDGGVSQATIESNTIRRYSVSLTAGANNWLDISSNGSVGAYVFWGWNLSLGTDVLPYAKTEAFALTAADYGLSVAGNLRTDFAEIVSESAGALNTFRVKAGTFGSYLLLADGAGSDNVTIECYEDGTQSNIDITSSASSAIRSGSPIFRVESNTTSVDIVTGGNDTVPPITIETEGTNGAKIQSFSTIRDPDGNITGLPGDTLSRKDGVNSGSYESLEATSGTNWFKRALNPPDQITIYSGAQFDSLATAGVITITQDTTFIVKVSGGFSTTTRIDVTGGDLMLTSEDYQSPGITYTGGGTFFTNHNPGSDIRVRGRLRFQGNGTGTFCSLLGLFGTGDAIIDMADTTIQDWADLGTVQQGVFISNNVSYVSYGAPFKILNTSIAFGENILAFGGLFIDISSVRAGAESDTVKINGITPLGLSGSLFRIDPFLADDSRVSITDVDTGDLAVNIFDVSGGTNGTFTAVADSSLGIQAVSSVADDGGGNAVFTATVAPIVGQTVLLFGFVTNTAYNGTFFCSARTATTFEVTDGVNQVQFGTTEAGAVSGDGVQVTSTAHGLSNGDTLTINTDDTVEYDGGYIIYNVQTNTFDIDAVFGVTQAGVWDTSGLDETNPIVLSFGNFGYPPSSVKAEISVNGNVATTSIPAAGAKVLINATGWITQTNERIKTDAEGDAIYTGITTAPAKLDGNVLLEPASSSKALSCQFIRQDDSRVTVNFTNSTNIVNEAGTSRVNGENITFHDTLGTLPAELRVDIIYYVISATASTFQVSYTLGGAAVTFTDDGSGTNSYAISDLHGSKPTEPISANNARTLVPQALEDLDTNNKTFIIITNEDDAVDIEVIDAYYRIAV